MKCGGPCRPEKVEELNAFLRAVADPTRLRIVCILKEGELCVCKIQEELDLPQNLVSHHLKALRECGLVRSRREGKWVHYSLDDAGMARMHAHINSIL